MKKKSNYNFTSTLKKIIPFVLGVAIIQLGVAIFISTNIGSDPFTAFTLGISKVIGISTGAANQIICAVFFILILILSWREIKIGTFIALIIAGPFINLMTFLIAPLHLNEQNIILKIIFLFLSCVIIGIGFSIQKATELGVAPNDLFILVLTSKSKVEYKWIRITFDLTALILGLILYGTSSLGTTIGIGTIISALCQGPIIQFFMPKIDKLINPIIEK